MSKLLDRMKKLSTVVGSSALSKSDFFKYDVTPTAIPILNLAFGGSVFSGLTGGITMLAGESRTFKTGLLIQTVKAFQVKHKTGVCVFYDSEFSSLAYWVSAGIDMDRVLHTPVVTIDELKHDMAKLLDSIEPEDKIMFVCDSIGGLASKKEAMDAIERADMPVDMTRAKTMNSLFRVVTPVLNKLKIDFVLINSFYETMDKYPTRVYAGGKKVFLSCDDVFFISRTKITQKETKKLDGFTFTLIADKSRTVIEGSKFPISVTFAGGIDRYSGLYDLGKEFGFISVLGAWVKVMDFDSGEMSGNKRVKDITSDFYEALITNEKFTELASKKYKLNG
jgi:hypothetical protein